MNTVPDLFDLLAHPLRWQAVQLLAAGDVRVHEMVEHLSEPMNLISYHLKKLRDAGIVTSRRSEADARDVYYTLDLDRLKALHGEATTALHPVLAHDTTIPPFEGTPRVLFVCSFNSARSQMAEAWMRHLSQTVETASAGIRKGVVHSEAVRAMASFGIDISDAKAKALSIYQQEPFDVLVTVCDIARKEAPPMPNTRLKLHWAIPDPARAPSEDQPAVFSRTATVIKERVKVLLTALPALLPAV